MKKKNYNLSNQSKLPFDYYSIIILDCKDRDPIVLNYMKEYEGRGVIGVFYKACSNIINPNELSNL
tara:strand:- start:847 stop:1044 length:198 start_codon:yes stop_codon:yes gene_type:complete